MKKIVLDIQSDIHAQTMERMLMQKLDDCQVVISESPDTTAEWCKTCLLYTSPSPRDTT